jgi:hypothetical protein
MAYTYITWLQLQTRFFDRLGDQVFYTNTGTYPETTLYLREALRVWNVLARFYRSRITFATAANTAWYKITDPTVVTNPANQLNFTMTIRDVVAEMQIMFMEPVSPTAWTGTDMFTLDQLVQAVQRRHDQFLLETAVTIDRIYPVVGAISLEGRMDLPQTVADVRRVSWVDNGTLDRTQLWRRDEWGARSQQFNWTLTPSDPPTGYSMSLTPPLGIQLIPPPSNAGHLDVLAVLNGPTLDTALNTLISIPDDYVWALKYGAMADLLGQEGQARDHSRTKYCEERWKQGVALASLEPFIFNVMVNNVPVPVTNLQGLDSNAAGWENGTGTPDMAAAYRDMLTLNPIPDGVYGITADILRPAPIPALPGDFVMLGPEQLDVILDYAHHIAAFKEAGAEFNATQRQLNNMIQLAGDHNNKLQALAVFREVFEDRSNREDLRRPRREPSEVASAS